jgi:hypothetical protein
MINLDYGDSGILRNAGNPFHLDSADCSPGIRFIYSLPASSVPDSFVCLQQVP